MTNMTTTTDITVTFEKNINDRNDWIVVNETVEVTEAIEAIEMTEITKTIEATKATETTETTETTEATEATVTTEATETIEATETTEATEVTTEVTEVIETETTDTINAINTHNWHDDGLPDRPHNEFYKFLWVPVNSRQWWFHVPDLPDGFTADGFTVLDVAPWAVIRPTEAN